MPAHYQGIIHTSSHGEQANPRKISSQPPSRIVIGRLGKAIGEGHGRPCSPITSETSEELALFDEGDAEFERAFNDREPWLMSFLENDDKVKILQEEEVKIEGVVIQEFSKAEKKEKEDEEGKGSRGSVGKRGSLVRSLSFLSSPSNRADEAKEMEDLKPGPSMLVTHVKKENTKIPAFSTTTSNLHSFFHSDEDLDAVEENAGTSTLLTRLNTTTAYSAFSTSTANLLLSSFPNTQQIKEMGLDNSTRKEPIKLVSSNCPLTPTSPFPHEAMPMNTAIATLGKEASISSPTSPTSPSSSQALPLPFLPTRLRSRSFGPTNTQFGNSLRQAAIASTSKEAVSSRSSSAFKLTSSLTKAADQAALFAANLYIQEQSIEDEFEKVKIETGLSIGSFDPPLGGRPGEEKG